MSRERHLEWADLAAAAGMRGCAMKSDVFPTTAVAAPEVPAVRQPEQRP